MVWIIDLCLWKVDVKNWVTALHWRVLPHRIEIKFSNHEDIPFSFVLRSRLIFVQCNPQNLGHLPILHVVMFSGRKTGDSFPQLYAAIYGHMLLPAPCRPEKSSWASSFLDDRLFWINFLIWQFSSCWEWECLYTIYFLFAWAFSVSQARSLTGVSIYMWQKYKKRNSLHWSDVVSITFMSVFWGVVQFRCLGLN